MLSVNKCKLSLLRYISNNNIFYRNLNNLNYCINLVQKSDYENYLSSLLLKENCRDGAFVLRAFQVELAQIRDLVSDRRIGQMRLQFWKDAIHNIYKNGEIPPSPIVQELKKLIERQNLSKMWFNRILEGRETQILTDNPFANIDEMDKLSEDIHSSMYYLLLQSIGINNIQCDHTASHLGKAHGIVTLLRALPYNASKNIVYLPVDLMVKHRLSQQEVIHLCRNINTNANTATNTATPTTNTGTNTTNTGTTTTNTANTTAVTCSTNESSSSSSSSSKSSINSNKCNNSSSGRSSGSSSSGGSGSSSSSSSSGSSSSKSSSSSSKITAEEKLMEVTFDLASIANMHMETVSKHWKELPKSAKLLFLSATPTKIYLKSIRKVNFNPLHRSLQGRNSWLPIVLLINKLKLKI